MTSRIGHLDLASGAAGDMILAALVGAGRRLHVDVGDAITAAVQSLGLGCEVSFEETSRGGLGCLVATVHGGDRHCGVDGLRKAIGEADVSPPAKEKATAALEALVLAESRAHAAETSEVHLHELGDADTAVDLVGTAAGLEALGVKRLTAAPVPVPRGWSSSAHGRLPLPAPATAELLIGLRVEGVDEAVELVTPTAAAILRTQASDFGPLPAMRLEAVGVGGGSRELDRANVCRLFVGSPGVAVSDATLETDVLLETNVDDTTPEMIGRTLEALMRAGAKDAWVTPIVMKKSRPAFQLSALADASAEQRLLEILFRETTTLGVRRRAAVKWTLPREVRTVSVLGAQLRVKIARLDGEIVTVAPEYEDCAALADRLGVAVRKVVEEAVREAGRQLDEPA